MAKQLWFTSTTSAAVVGRLRNDNLLNGAASWWRVEKLGEARGTSSTTKTATTVAGPTNGLEMATVFPIVVEWITDPLSADFTISGTITANLWAFESTTAANAAINFVLEKIDGATSALTQIAKSVRTTELGTTSAAANFTTTPTSTACKRGDRLRVRVYADDAAQSMGAGLTVTFSYSGPTAAADGDSYIQLTETLTFDTTTAPTGSTYYLTDTAETINPGSAIEKKALTTRGSGSVTSVTNTAAGPTSGVQVTDSAGGTAIEWYTPPLNAVTIGGVAKFNVRGLESSSSANAIFRGEIAVVASDGSGAAVWAVGLPQQSLPELSNISDVAIILIASGDDTAVSAGQRLRFRVYADDTGGTEGALAAGFTVTTSYNGATAAAAGDSYVILPVAVTEQVAAATKKPRIVSSRVPAMRAALR